MHIAHAQVDIGKQKIPICDHTLPSFGIKFMKRHVAEDNMNKTQVALIPSTFLMRCGFAGAS